jgi:hypothetical protein
VHDRVCGHASATFESPTPLVTRPWTGLSEALASRVLNGNPAPTGPGVLDEVDAAHHRTVLKRRGEAIWRRKLRRRCRSRPCPRRRNGSRHDT